jgi:antitoxin component HigA of HigAB toxin-antitoxin module
MKTAMESKGTILEALAYGRQNALMPSGDYDKAVADIHNADVTLDERNALMKRHSDQVEVIRQIIDERGLTAEEKQLLKKLCFETNYDRRNAR